MIPKLEGSSQSDTFGVVKKKYFPLSVALSVLTHKWTKMICYWITDSHFVLFTHLLFNVDWILQLLCLSEGDVPRGLFQAQDTCGRF